MPAKHSQRRTRFIRVAFFSLAFALVPAASFLLSKTYAGKASVSVANLPSSETQAARKTEISETRQKKLQAALLNLPLSFEAGPGTNEFRTRGHGYSLLLTATGLHFAFARDRGSKGLKLHRIASHDEISIKLIGANDQATAVGLEQLPGKTNYLLGNDPTKWRTDVSNFAKVRYENVYSGIDLLYYGNGHQIEYDFHVSPGADPRAIKFRFDRKATVETSSEGGLILKAASHQIREQKPIVYQ